MKVLGIIPARFGSSRFPGKPLVDLKGKSMIQRVYEGAKQCELISHLVVATDDQRIIDHVRSFGGNVMMTQVTHNSGTERCGEIANHFPGMEVVINIQGDEPLLNPEQLTQLIKTFEQESINIATLVTPKVTPLDLTNSNRIKVVIGHDQRALYFSRNVIPSMAYPSAVIPLKHIGLYAYRTETLKKLIALEPCELEKSESLEQLRWLYHGFSIHTVETLIETPNIDVPEDVEVVLRYL